MAKIPQVPERVSEIAREVASLVRAEIGDDARVIWFGSWVSGTAVPRSDLDIAISSPHLTEEVMARVEDKIEGLPTLYHMDLINLSDVGAEMRRKILEEGLDL
jgi:predicted nucleotidyltransferase